MPRVFGFRGVWGVVSVDIDLFLAELLRVLGRFGPGLSQGLSLGVVSNLAIRFMYCSAPAFELLFSYVCNSKDKKMHQESRVELATLLDDNEKLRAEIRAQQAERESYVLWRDKAYGDMRNELELQMELYKGKAIELQTENYIVKAELEVMTNRAEGMNSKEAKQVHSNLKDKRKRMGVGLQKKKELARKTRSQVLKAFDWKQDTADPVLLAAACAFWDSFNERAEGQSSWRKQRRVSKFDRMVAWKEITLKGWNGKVHKEIDSEFMARKRYCAIKMAKASDMESKFNVKVSTDIAHCDPASMSAVFR